MHSLSKRVTFKYNITNIKSKNDKTYTKFNRQLWQSNKMQILQLTKYHQKREKEAEIPKQADVLL